MKAWLFRIVHKLPAWPLRRKGALHVPVHLMDYIVVASRSGPADSNGHQTELARLQLALSQLSSTQAEVIALRFGGEMTCEQVAQVLNKPPDTVRQMQSQAIKKLGKAILDQRD